MISGYINTKKNNKKKLIELKKAIFRYQLLCNQFNQKLVDEAILEVKNEKKIENLTDIELFLAYEQEIKKIVWNKHSKNVVSPNKEIAVKDIGGLAKKYNTTKEVAQIIIDLNITDAYNAAALAQTILRYDLKENPNAIELAHIIFNNELFMYPNTVMLAEAFFKFNLKDSPDAIRISRFITDNNLMDNSDAIRISRFITDNNLMDNSDAVKIYYFVVDNNLKNNPDAISIANMVCKLGISLDLAMEVSQYNHGAYSFKQFDEKYVFHKLRQLYQIKMKIEQNFNFQQEKERIMYTIGIDSLKAKYFLVCCMANDWGRNSSFYWDYNRYKNDFNNNQQYTDEEISVIRGYTRRPTINKFARGFKTHNGTTYFNDGTYPLAMDEKEIEDSTNNNYIPLYKALNKNSLSKDVIVFRGARISSLLRYKINMNDSEEEAKKKLAGKYQDGGFMSTSVVIEKEGSFLDNEVNFIIDLKSGTPCGDLSGYTDFDDECEILLPPNVTFTVNDVKKIDGKFFVYLTSIPTKSLSYFDNIGYDDNNSKSESRHL